MAISLVPSKATLVESLLVWVLKVWATEATQWFIVCKNRGWTIKQLMCPAVAHPSIGLAPQASSTKFPGYAMLTICFFRTECLATWRMVFGGLATLGPFLWLLQQEAKVVLLIFWNVLKKQRTTVKFCWWNSSSDVVSSIISGRVTTVGLSHLCSRWVNYFCPVRDLVLSLRHS